MLSLLPGTPVGLRKHSSNTSPRSLDADDQTTQQPISTTTDRNAPITNNQGTTYTDTQPVETPSPDEDKR